MKKGDKVFYHNGSTHKVFTISNIVNGEILIGSMRYSNKKVDHVYNSMTDDSYITPFHY